MFVLTLADEASTIANFSSIAEKWGPLGGVMIFIVLSIVGWKYTGAPIMQAIVAITKEHTLQTANIQKTAEILKETTQTLQGHLRDVQSLRQQDTDDRNKAYGTHP